jgi:hypothetical protein
MCSIPKKFQQDDTLVHYFIISCKSLYMFRVKHSSIIRSSIKLYLQHLVSTNRVWPVVVVDEPEFRLIQSSNMNVSPETCRATCRK